MLATRTCYYSRYQVFRGEDMALIETGFFSQLYHISKCTHMKIGNLVNEIILLLQVFWMNKTNTLCTNQARKLTSKGFRPHCNLNSLHSNPNKWSVLLKELQFVHHFTHQEMRSEIDVEIVKIRGIIYQQNLGVDFESRGNLWTSRITSRLFECLAWLHLWI